MPTNKQRREAERRRLQRQAQRRRRLSAQRRRMNLLVSIVGAVVVLAIIIVFIVATTDDDKTPTAHQGKPAPTSSTATSNPPTPTRASTPPPKRPTSTPPKSPSTSRTATKPTSTPPRSPSNTPTSTAPVGTVGKTVQCTYTPTGVKAARKVNRPPTKAAASGTVDVAITTSQGNMTFSLNRAAAPCTVNNFVSLVDQKYYNATPCHRLVTKTIFVTQCGDPTGTGTGGPGYKFDDELTGKENYTRGILAMANGGANSNGSQFFIVYRRSALGPQYTIFGRVSAGIATVDKVAAAGTADGSTDGKPKLPLTIRTATVS